MKQAIPEISTEINKRDNNLSISQSNNKYIKSQKEPNEKMKKRIENRFDYELFNSRYKRILNASAKIKVYQI